MKREVQKSTGGVKRSSSLNLSIFNHIKEGKRPSQICKILDLKKTTLQYYLSSLKQSKLIKKIGYGVWEITGKFDQKKFKKIIRVTPNNWGSKFELLLPDKVRGHAFQFKLLIPENLRNWDRRVEILENKNFEFKYLKHLFGGGQSLNIKGRKVHLTNNSVIIYERESYIADLARDSKSSAIYHFLNLVRVLERHLGADFSIQGQYKFRVTRQHYALIKNALAKQYDKEGKKLQVYSANGLWFVIDNSYNLHEAETVHPKSAVSDNEKVQNFFNSLKDNPTTTHEIDSNLQEVKDRLKTSSENQIMLSQVLDQVNKNTVKIVKQLGGDK